MGQYGPINLFWTFKLQLNSIGFNSDVSLSDSTASLQTNYNIFSSLVKSSLVKLETSLTVILTPYSECYLVNLLCLTQITTFYAFNAWQYSIFV